MPPFETLADIITQAVWSKIASYDLLAEMEASDADDLYEEVSAAVNAKIKERIG